MDEGTRRDGMLFSAEVLVNMLHKHTDGSFPKDATVLGVNFLPQSYGVMVYFTSESATPRLELTTLAPPDVAPRIEVP